MQRNATYLTSAVAVVEVVMDAVVVVAEMEGDQVAVDEAVVVATALSAVDAVFDLTRTARLLGNHIGTIVA